MCSLACKIKKIKEKPPEKRKTGEKMKKRMSHGLCPLTDENKEKNAENLKKARKNDEKTEL